jgi:hypothetical protein
VALIDFANGFFGSPEKKNPHHEKANTEIPLQLGEKILDEI